MWNTELPITNSTGSNPAASSRANSLTDRSLVHTLPASASRADAMASGSNEVMAGPFSR